MEMSISKDNVSKRKTIKLGGDRTEKIGGQVEGKTKINNCEVVFNPVQTGVPVGESKK